MMSLRGMKPKTRESVEFGAMVAKAEVGTGGDDDGRACGPRLGRLAVVDVRLGELDAVDEHVAVAEVDAVARQADDPLDERHLGRIGRRGAGRVEDDDVAALVVVEAGRELVHEHVLPGLERVLHALLLDLVGLSHEVLDEQEDHDRQDEGFEDLEEASPLASIHRTRSIRAPPALTAPSLPAGRASMDIPGRRSKVRGSLYRAGRRRDGRPAPDQAMHR